ncbi:MAG: hypothetical protein A3I75_04860 [Deltaproteobacteria bacterium RIFCSPLOWO2_02_FULL_50_16]|nr:MAG: hypothetical protein A3I75_04860 [Deltaproteobacteria bacterium RIFCSPLOWO2_02_FULL_50_16]OGQ67826.1 MAG: hypothetical protein A3F89_02380 [Deltaproteobacteria bacterium RIFCSPLOWO2_12_FULL_50_11]
MIRKLLSLVFIVVVLFFLSHLEYRGKPVRQYFQDFFRQPSIQTTIRQAKALIQAYLEKDVGNKTVEDHLTEEDRRELERILKQELDKIRR